MKKIFQPLLIFGVSICALSVYAQTPPANFDEQAQKILADHYNQYKVAEYFSGASLSIYIPNQPIKNYYIGRVAHDPKSKLVTSDTLFQIGSITKSFTAAILLQLEKEGRLKLSDSLKNWLPQYNKWSTISLMQLLNMTSGIPNYSETPLFNSQIYYNLARVWTDQELINFANPPGAFAPSLMSGYFYSNTNYILAALLIEKATRHTFADELNQRLIRVANLNNTLYVLNTPDTKTQSRLAHGYFYDQYNNPAMVGKDIYEGNLSWAAAAGGIMASSEDIVKWVKALFVDDKILDTAQKTKLMNLVSQQTGQSINQTTLDEPRGFGLGVAQADTDPEDSLIGRVWFYEGETLGFRSMYWYKVCNGVIISAVFNSATNSKNDHAGKLLEAAYHLIITQYPQLNCQDTDT